MIQPHATYRGRFVGAIVPDRRGRPVVAYITGPAWWRVMRRMAVAEFQRRFVCER